MQSMLSIHKLRPAIILLLAALFAGSLIIFSKKPVPQPKSETAWPVEARKANKTSISPNTMVFGQIESQQQANLRSTVIGTIIDTPGKEGAFVSKGIPIVTIDPTEAKLEVQQKQAEVNKIEAELKSDKERLNADEKILKDQKRLIELLNKSVSREMKLKKQSVGSQSRIDEAEQASVRDQISFNERQFAIDNFSNRQQILSAHLSRAKAELDLATLDLKRTQILAPFDGRISKKLVAIGDRVQPNQNIISIYDTSKLEIRAEFPTTAISELQQYLDLKKEITANIIDDPIDSTITLDRLAGQIEINQGGIDALFTIDASNSPLRLGQTVKLLVSYPAYTDVFTVPQSTIYNTDSGYRLFKIIEKQNEKRLQSVVVKKIGNSISLDGTNESIISSDKINENDLILITRLPYARDGLKVTVSE
jgi:RND family efflux transporter MFP subunit